MPLLRIEHLLLAVHIGKDSAKKKIQIFSLLSSFQGLLVQFPSVVYALGS